MTTEEVLIQANKIVGVDLSDKMLCLLSSLLDNPDVSCDGLVLLIRELQKEVLLPTQREERLI